MTGRSRITENRMAAKPAGTHIDTAAAEAFEAWLVPTIFGPWSRALVDLAAPRPGERLLDVGCGTGAAARYAAAQPGGGAVAAIDLNAGMIVHARTLGPAGAVDWREGDILAMPFADGAFDVIVGNQVLQFLPDRPKALAEIRRVLAEDGRAVFGVYCRIELCPAHCAVAEALKAHDVDPAGIRNPYGFGDPVALGDAIAAAGFRDVSVVRRTMEARFASPAAFVEALAAGGPSARHALEQLDADGLRQVIADVTAALADYVDEAGLRVITASNLAVARR
jgi:SAM-dependent methyltransferase